MIAQHTIVIKGDNVEEYERIFLHLSEQQQLHPEWEVTPYPGEYKVVAVKSEDVGTLVKG